VTRQSIHKATAKRALSAAIALTACSGVPTPDANGYDVQLYFDVGTTLALGEPQTVTVQRIEQRPDRCDMSDIRCDPTMHTPITLINAACSSLCTVSPVATSGVIRLDLTAETAGETTLHVSVRSDVDGSEWDDAYPLVFR
jgi:hypothetical protein